MEIRGFIPIFLLCYIVFFSSSPRSSSVSAQKVPLALYYETLCPYSANFIVNDLPKIFENGLIDIVDLKLVPYGNARVGSNGTIACQHGPYECLLNTVHACALHAWPDLSEHFPFIYCIEKLVYERQYRQWESCFGKTGLDVNPIAECYSSGLGRKLELQYAAETDALEPPHKYVPWVVVDGQPIYEDYENFITYICNAYKGAPVPKGCQEQPLQIIPRGKENQNHQVSFPRESSASTSSDEIPTKLMSHVPSWMRQRKIITSQ